MSLDEGGAATPRVLIVEDHELLATTLTLALRGRGYMIAHSPGRTDEEVVAEAAAFRPTVALLDLDLGSDRTSLPLIEPLTALGARVLMLTGSTDRIRLAECVEAGAVGLLAKAGPLDDVVRAVEEAGRGGSLLSPPQRTALLAELGHQREERGARHRPFERLTPREREVLTCLVEGKTAQEIATATTTSIRTVRGHIQTVLDKLDVHSQLAAVAKAKQVGWPPSTRAKGEGP